MSNSTFPPSTQPWPPRLLGWAMVTAAALVIVVGGWIAYGNSFQGPFIFDDLDQIDKNPQLQKLWPIWAPMANTPRPVGNLSFALNYRYSGTNVWSYHVTNLVIHLLAGVVLFDLVRRTLRRRKEQFTPLIATALALAVGLLWTVHPLQTQAVTYIVQRLESLMGLFYLLTLYGFARAQDSRWPWLWYALSIGACALGMGTKEVIATAPLMVLWYDRVFVAGSWDAVRTRWRYYVPLAATWSILAALMFANRAGYLAGKTLVIEGVSPLGYALSQPGVICHYLGLAFWPKDLCLDYAWPLAETAREILPPLAVILGLLTLTGWCTWRWPAWGFVGGRFFMVLSVTSSVVPIIDLAFEHRMYLPLAAVVTTVVVGGFTAARAALARLGLGPTERLTIGIPVMTLLVMGVSIAMAARTQARNKQYQSSDAARTSLTIWDDTVFKMPKNARARNNRGNMHARRGELREAIADYDKAIELDPKYALAYNNRGAIKDAIGDHEGGIEDCTKALSLEKEYADAFYNRGHSHHNSGHYHTAVEDYTQALKLSPEYAEALNNRGAAYMCLQDYGNALKDFTRAMELRPEFGQARKNRGDVYVKLDRHEEAIADYSEVIRRQPDFAQAYNDRGNAYNAIGRYPQAVADYMKAIEINPNYAEAYHNLGVAHYYLRAYEQAWADIRMCRKLGGHPKPEFLQLLTRESGHGE